VYRPAEGRADVVVLLLEAVEPGRVLLEEVRLRRLGHRDELPRVAAKDLLFLSALGETLGRELADRLEHPIPRPLPREDVHAYQALIDQRLDAVEDVDVEPGAAHLLRRAERPAPGEDGEPREEALLRRIEEVVAPLDRAGERPLTIRRVPRAAREER